MFGVQNGLYRCGHVSVQVGRESECASVQMGVNMLACKWVVRVNTLVCKWFVRVNMVCKWVWTCWLRRGDVSANMLVCNCVCVNLCEHGGTGVSAYNCVRASE